MMTAMRGGLLVGLTAALLAVAAPAQAVTLIPPGKAGASQYFETIPNAAGNTPPPSGIGSASPTAGGAAAQTLASFGRGRAGAATLARLGATGRAAAALAGATAPSPDAGFPTAASRGSSPLSAITKALGNTSSGGLGLVLPLVMATAVVLVLAVIGRRLLLRHQGPPELGA
jgi:hypothetical protein